MDSRGQNKKLKMFRNRSGLTEEQCDILKCRPHLYNFFVEKNRNEYRDRRESEERKNQWETPQFAEGTRGWSLSHSRVAQLRSPTAPTNTPQQTFPSTANHFISPSQQQTVYDSDSEGEEHDDNTNEPITDATTTLNMSMVFTATIQADTMPRAGEAFLLDISEGPIDAETKDLGPAGNTYHEDLTDMAYQRAQEEDSPSSSDSEGDNHQARATRGSPGADHRHTPAIVTPAIVTPAMTPAICFSPLDDKTPGLEARQEEADAFMQDWRNLEYEPGRDSPEGTPVAREHEPIPELPPEEPEHYSAEEDDQDPTAVTDALTLAMCDAYEDMLQEGNARADQDTDDSRDTSGYRSGDSYYSSEDSFAMAMCDQYNGITLEDG